MPSPSPELVRARKLVTRYRRIGVHFHVNKYIFRARSKNKNCRICKAPVDRFVVDHDHKTNTFRGLICRNCNIGLGLFKDSPKTLVRAAAYLRRHMKVQPPRPEQSLKSGVPTKALFIKHIELEYWQLIEEIQKQQNFKTVADAIRYSLKKSTGRI